MFTKLNGSYSMCTLQDPNPPTPLTNPPPTQKEVLNFFFFFGFSVCTPALTRPADRPCLHHMGVGKDISEFGWGGGGLS